jgi:hypothetical protein
MKRFAIPRIAMNRDGTFGVFIECDVPQIGNVPFAATLERRWENNQKGISCIPDAIYVCKRVQSPKFGNTFEVVGVPDRDEIRFHWGDIDLDTHGCVVVAEYFEALYSKIDNLMKTAIVNPTPKKGFEEFLKRTTGIDEFMLDIFWVPGVKH